MKNVLREKLLEPYLTSNNFGGIRYFEKLPLDVLKMLIGSGFVEMDCWNACPGVAEAFLPFLRRHPEFAAHGYVVDWARKDSRVTVEGVEAVQPIAKLTLIDFAKTFRGADDLEIRSDYARCWYD